MNIHLTVALKSRAETLLQENYSISETKKKLIRSDFDNRAYLGLANTNSLLAFTVKPLATNYRNVINTLILGWA
jgi:hypothetical protein